MAKLQTFETRIRAFSKQRLSLVNGELACRVVRNALVGATIGLLLLAGWINLAFVNLGVALVLLLVWLGLAIRFVKRREHFKSILDEAFVMESLIAVNSRLISAISFIEEGQSSPLTDHVIRRAEEDLKTPFEAELPRVPFEAARKNALVWLVVFLILAVLPATGVLKAFSTLQTSWKVAMDRLFPVNYTLTPSAGTHIVKLGDGIDVAIQFEKPAFDTVYLVWQPIAETSADTNSDSSDTPDTTGAESTDKAPETAEPTELTRVPLTVGSDFKASHRLLLDHEGAVLAWFEFGERKSEALTVIFTSLPTLVNMQTELIYPSYTRQLPRTLEGVQPRLLGLEGTRITIGFTFSKDLESASFTWDNGSVLPLDTVGRYASTSMMMNRTQQATLQVVDQHGFQLEYPLVIDFERQEDEKPVVVLPRHLKDDMPMLAEQVPSFGFSVRAQDDYGVSKCVLQWQKVTVDNPTSILDRGEAERAISPSKRKVQVNFDEVFSSMSLVPGDKIIFFVEVYDNRKPDAQRASSPRRSFFVYQQDLAALNIRELGFGSADLGRTRLAKIKRATSVKQPEGQRTAEKVSNEYEQVIQTSTRAPTVRGEFRNATEDYLRVLSSVAAQTPPADANAAAPGGAPPSNSETPESTP